MGQCIRHDQVHVKATRSSADLDTPADPACENPGLAKRGEPLRTRFFAWWPEIARRTKTINLRESTTLVLLTLGSFAGKAYF